MGTFKEHSMLIMEKQGPSLEHLLRTHNFKFNLQSLSLLAVKLIDTLETMHDNDILHGFLSPHNILVGRTVENKHVFLISFKHSARLVSKKSVVFQENHTEIFEDKGINEFSSINKCLGIPLSKKDDLESAIYILLYLFHGGRISDNQFDKSDQVKKIVDYASWKSQSSVEVICKNTPPCFSMYLHHIRSHNPQDRPKYGFLRSLFSKNSDPKLGMQALNILAYDLHKIITNQQKSSGELPVVKLHLDSEKEKISDQVVGAELPNSQMNTKSIARDGRIDENENGGELHRRITLETASNVVHIQSKENSEKQIKKPWKVEVTPANGILVENKGSWDNKGDSFYELSEQDDETYDSEDIEIKLARLCPYSSE